MLAGGERGTTKGFSAHEVHDASRADVGWIPLFQPEKQHAFVPLPRLVYDDDWITRRFPVKSECV